MSDVQRLSAMIVAAFVRGPRDVRADQLGPLLRDVSATLAALAEGGAVTPAAIEDKTATPAVPIRQSVFQDRIICLECGKPYVLLTGHIGQLHGQTPWQYRARWGLPITYPMAAASYNATRSAMAKTQGLGRRQNT